MMKSKNTDEIIGMMKNNDTDAIIYGAESNIPILNLNAVIFGVKYRVSSDQFISLLKDKLLKSEVSFFGMKFSKIVTAALDVLNIEKYYGDDKLIMQLINSQFNF